MTTWIEVVDTAVKIGLGAIITGFAAYIHAKQSRQADSIKEYESRHRSLLEEVASQVEKVNHIYLKYWALKVEYIRLRTSGQEQSEKRIKDTEQVSEELFSAFGELTNAESKLLLVNEANGYERLRELGEKIVKFRRMNLAARPEVDEDEMIKLRDEIREKRNELYEILSSSYKKNFT